MEIHQILPNMAYGDAISSHAIELKRIFKILGYKSEIYALVREGAVTQNCRPLNEFESKNNSITLYHYSIGSRRVSDLFLSSKGKRVLVYHNITPAHFFEKYSPLLCDLLRKGRDSLSLFKDHVDLAIGDSEYNVEELNQLGYSNTRTMPIFVSFDRFEKTKPDKKMLRYLGKGWTTFLFTGRLAPNKAPHDVIRSFAWYHKNIDQLSRLILVGTVAFSDYLRDLLHLAKALGVDHCVFFPGHVKFSELISIYKSADLFLCLSEHEGFCVPLLEAMYFDIPILAYQSTGVPFTLGNSGILLKSKSPQIVAETAQVLIKNVQLRKKIIHNQRQRLNDYHSVVLTKRYKEMIESLLPSYERSSETRL